MENLTTNLDSPNDKEVISPIKSVLVIDDSIDALDLQKFLLGSVGYDVFTAESGDEAMQVLAEIAEPNLILLDMQLGDMNGIEFLAILEEKRPEIIQHVPVVFLTGMDEVPKSKAIGFIRKPADTDKFLKAVSHFVEKGFLPPYKH